MNVPKCVYYSLHSTARLAVIIFIEKKEIGAINLIFSFTVSMKE